MSSSSPAPGSRKFLATVDRMAQLGSRSTWLEQARQGLSPPAPSPPAFEMCHTQFPPKCVLLCTLYSAAMELAVWAIKSRWRSTNPIRVLRGFSEGRTARCSDSSSPSKTSLFRSVERSVQQGWLLSKVPPTRCSGSSTRPQLQCCHAQLQSKTSQIQQEPATIRSPQQRPCGGYHLRSWNRFRARGLLHR